MMHSRRDRVSAIAFAALLIGCGGSGPAGVGDPPAAPTADDPRFVVGS